MDELEEVRQRFTAQVNDYLAEVKAAAEEAKRFAAANEEAKVTLDSVRDKALEAAAALKITRDEQGKLRNSAGEVIAASEAEALALKHIRDQALEAAWATRELDKYQKQGLLSRLGGGISGGLSSFFTGNGGGMGSGLMSLPAILAIVAAVETLLPELVGLISGFAAAGAGAGAFAILAIPAIKGVSTAYQQINADQQAYNRALTASARNTALAHLKKDWAGLSEPQRDAIDAIRQLTGEWHKLSNAFTPEAMKVFTGVLKLANELLPQVTPWATTFADALSGLLGKAGNFAGSSGFKDWLAQFHTLEGPSITAIGDGIGKVANAIGKLLTVMSKKDVVNAINIAFTILAGTVEVITYMLKRLMDNWDGMSVAAKHSWYDIKRWTDDVTQAFDTVRHFAAEMGHDTAAYFDFMRHHVAILAHDVAAHFDEIRHDIAHWADVARQDVDKVVGWFEKLPGRILKAIESLPGKLETAGSHAASMFVSGLKSVPVVGTVVGWAQDIWDNLPHSPAKKGPLSGAGSPDKSGLAIATMLAQGMTAGLPQIRAALTAMTSELKGRLGYINNEITQARQLAASTASSVAGNYTISGFATSGMNGGAATAGQVVSGLRAGVAQIRQWAGNIKRLAKEGLNKSYLAQLIALGPVNGAALVAELANAGLGDIKAINSAEYEINQASGQVGKMAANIQYEGSRAAGQGFLDGLLAQKHQIQALMESIATAMALTFRKGLAGTAGGVPLGGASGANVHVNIPVNVQGGAGPAYQSPQFQQYLQGIVQEAILRYGQMNPGNGLTPMWGH